MSESDAAIIPEQIESIEEKEKRLAELLATGKRALKLNDAETAADALSDAAELSSEIYGEDNEKTFEPILYYGMAALELAKAESQLLKNPGEKEEKEEEKEGEEKEEEDEKEDGEESGEEEEDENDSMKLAWELLETARCIATAKIESLEASQGGISLIETWNLKLSDVLVHLGEHSMADGKYTQAQEDLTRALEIQSNILEKNSRIIAQTYILIGNACSLDARYDETVNFYEKTKQILTENMEELEKKQKEDKENSDLKTEIDDLKEMIPEVDAMIQDAQNSAAQAEEVKKTIKAQFEGFTSMISQISKPEDGKEKEANDITNMIRRPAKRPTEATAENTDDKKKKTEEGESDL